MVVFEWNSSRLEAILNEGGWLIPGGLDVLVRLINKIASPLLFGPEHGDPIRCAANKAAQFLDGKVVHVRELPPHPKESSD